ncbi:galectin-3b [Clarias gariepinus]|uniref:galectin-3b n=1 Tax=Clarias gariepinus TaxID=13013 RepID=UPI00234C2017|nr:galectin-3b [Clarias gariepinus]
MDLADALDSDPATANQTNQQAGGPAWPGQPANPAWPGQPASPAWPGQPQNPSWPGQPQNPSWPGQPGGQPFPQWPNQPYQPQWPGQPGQPGQPTAPGWPGQIPPTAPQNVPLNVPLDMPLPQGVYDKLLITIQGEPKPNAKKFSINLARNKDIALHFNPRFDEDGIKVLVRNSMISDVWGKEERTAPSFPFIPGKPFEVKILCTATDFKVAVNKAHMFEYKHRLRELNQINHLTIIDDVKITSVNFENLP